MKERNIKSLIKVARLHESHLSAALNDLSGIFPITEEKVQNLTREEFLLLDGLVYHFTKLYHLQKLANII